MIKNGSWRFIVVWSHSVLVSHYPNITQKLRVVHGCPGVMNPNCCTFFFEDGSKTIFTNIWNWWCNLNDVAILGATTNLATLKDISFWSIMLYYKQKSLTIYQLVNTHALNCAESCAVLMKIRYGQADTYSCNETTTHTMMELLYSPTSFVMHLETAWSCHKSNRSQGKHSNS